MKGQVTEVYKIYDSRDRELVIPVYQRNYDWKEKQCKQLLDDLHSIVVESRPKHFFGAVVGKPEGTWKWVVIDGQQRLTTVSLLMLALAHSIRDGRVIAEDSTLGEKIVRNYLMTDLDAVTPKFRLKPVKDDADAYRRLFGPEQEFIESSNVTANYRYFRTQLSQTPLNAEQLWEAICALEVMHLDLEEHDDPQRIFESLNSTGLELSEADKVRNLVLMGLPEVEQNLVYEDFWNRIEKNVDFKTDAFLRWYLVTKTSITPRLDQVYETFKQFALDSEASGASLLTEVRLFSEIFRQIQRADTGISSVDRRLKRLNILKQDVILPLLMPLINDFRLGAMVEADLSKSLEIIESYLFRRFVCGFGSNALNKIFATAYKDVRRMQSSVDKFSDVLAYSFIKRGGSGTFPSDDVFVETFETRDFYSISAERRRYLFECLENENSNEVRDVAQALEAGSLTIEHVMPQTLSPAWRAELGEAASHVHQVNLHRIGNLTVTGYNSTYSNLSFIEKKNMDRGFNDSPYRLNRSISREQQWTQTEIETRSSELASVALQYWRYPTTNFAPVRTGHSFEAMGDVESFTNRDVLAYEFDGASGTVRSWRDVLVAVVHECARLRRDDVFEHARENPFAYRVDGEFEGRSDSFIEVVPGLEVSVSNSTDTKINWIRRLFRTLDLDSESLIFTLRETASENQDELAKEFKKFSEYEELKRFIPEIENSLAEGISIEPITVEFIRAFAPWRLEYPIEVLGAPLSTFLQDKSRVGEASADELRALISARISESEMFDPDAMKRSINDGSLNDWLRHLVQK